MNKKIISIFVSMLLCVTVFSVTGAVNVEKTVYKEPNTSSTDIVWSENFDSYALGSSMHGQGGAGWRVVSTRRSFDAQRGSTERDRVVVGPAWTPCHQYPYVDETAGSAAARGAIWNSV